MYLFDWDTSLYSINKRILNQVRPGPRYASLYPPWMRRRLKLYRALLDHFKNPFVPSVWMNMKKEILYVSYHVNIPFTHIASSLGLQVDHVPARCARHY
jgi:hypothetical protein